MAFRGLSRFCRLNPKCPDHGKRGHGNLTATARYGPRRTRMLRRLTRTARFSERKGTPLFGTRLPPAAVADILAHAAEGGGHPHDRSAGRRPPRHRRPLRPRRRPPRSATARRTRGFLPRRRLKPSSTRSGISSARKRRTASRGRLTPATVGAASPSTRRAGWWRVRWSASGSPRRPASWSGISAAERPAGSYGR